MAFGDNAQDFTTLDDAIARYYKMNPKSQFNRLGKTAAWFKARMEEFKGKSFHYEAFTTPSTGVRRLGLAAARAAAMPAPSDLAYQPLSITKADLIEFRGGAKINEQDDIFTTDAKYAAARLAMKVIDELETDFAGQLNAALYQGQNCAIGTIAAIYDADGTTFTGAGDKNPAFIRITDASLGHFEKGMKLDIYDATSTGGSDIKNNTVTVNAKIVGRDGPPVAGARVADIGPGIIVTPDNNWNAVAVPAAGDFLARDGEFSTDTTAPTNIHGMPDWFDTTVDVYRDEAGNLLDRESPDNLWMNPEVYDYTSGGNPVTFDLQEHFRDAEDTLPDRVDTARIKRRSAGSDKGPTVMDSMLATARPELITEATQDARYSTQFTRTLAMNLDEAKRQKLFGQSGFDGIVYNSPTLGTVAFQADIGARPNEIMLIEPNSFFWLTKGGQTGHLNWATQGGSKWVRVTDETTGRLTHFMQCAAYFLACLGCDQPGANVLIKGIKSSRV